MTPLTSETAASLLDLARNVRENAYAPYSGFRVGAALLDAEGHVHRGVNVENASLGLTICAERVAVSGAVTAGARSFVAIAIAGPEPGVACMPCGACRQVLWEMSSGLFVIVEGAGGASRIPLRDLLPEPFETSPSTRLEEEG